MSEYLYYQAQGLPPVLDFTDFYSNKPQHPFQQPDTQAFEIDFNSFGFPLSAEEEESSHEHDFNSPTVPLSVGEEEFSNELDNILSADDTTVPIINDSSALFESFRTRTPTRGVPSTFTVSSESASAYASNYNETDSVYTTHSQSPSEVSVLYQQFGYMSFPNVNLDSDASVYSAPSPVSPQGSPNSNLGMNISAYPPGFAHRGSFSDYEPARIRVPPSSASDYYPQVAMPVKYMSSVMQATVSPANVSASLPQTQPLQTAVVASQRPEKQENLSRAPTTKDPKRKYQCPSCPRAFARAFNLKTHIQTHDPNRSKPYACSHKSCGRAFSRKHDLTRHLISIHRSDAESIGVASTRSRCADCGASWAPNGKESCDCNNVK